MVTQKIKKLKKYLFFISIMFFVLTFSHLTASYLYSNSKIMPEKWWTISEWIVWNFPNLNPLVPIYSDWNEKYIIELLYRSLLKFDLEQQKIVWDIATCDISSLINIQCIINEWAKWSNWENITSEDVVSTYQLIRETSSNKVLISLLADTDIIAKENTVIFKNKRKDVNFLNIFLQPILNKDFINTLSQENITWKFPTEWWIYSWKFVIEKIFNDENLWITKIVLQKNEFFDNSNINKIILNIFPDINSLRKNFQNINIFNDSENNIWNSIYKFQNYKYSLNSFVWLFLNQNKIKNSDLRTYILNRIDSEKLLNILWKEHFKKVKNPFLNEEEINKEVKNKNFDSLMKSLWYKKKSSFIQELLPEKNKLLSNSDKKVEFTIPDDLSLDRYQKDSAIIFSPSYVDLYNFITKDDVLLKWKTKSSVDAVYINDYKLNNFKSWNPEFYYRIKESIWNLKTWKNIYKIFFEIWGKKELQEEIIFVYNKDKEKLKEEEKNLAIELYKKEFEQKNLENNSEKEEENEEKINKNKELTEKINSLDENIFYDKNFKEFSLKLYYIEDWKKETQSTVEFIKNSLREIWIIVELNSFSIKDLSKVISNKDDYDLILTWVHLWYLKFNMFPYFHSSQAKTWYNFSNIRKTSLDLLLEELKENIYTEQRTNEIEKKVLEILKEEQVFKTLYTPEINFLVDKSIKIWKIYSNLPYKSERWIIIEKSYTKEKKEINFENKSFWWFFNYLIKKLYD